MPKKSPLTLYQLGFDEALANLLAVKPVAKGKKSPQKPKAVRRKAKKRRASKRTD